jgi:hypothetical protein
MKPKHVAALDLPLKSCVSTDYALIAYFIVDASLGGEGNFEECIFDL